MQVIADASMVGIRVDKALSIKLNISRSQIEGLDIYVNNKLVKNSYKLELEDVITFDMEDKIDNEPYPVSMDIDIIYEDEYMAIINKPYGLAVHPSDTSSEITLVHGLMSKFNSLSNIIEKRAGIVHRLDKDTSGLLIIAKTNEAHIRLSEMFKNHEIDKTYIAILSGNLSKDSIKISSYIGRDKKDRKKMSSNSNNGKLAISIFNKLAENNNKTLVSVNILTGRTHQIRVHSKDLKAPVYLDQVYSKSKEGRQQLHAYKLSFIHPFYHKKMDFISELPDDMKENIERLGLNVEF